MLTFEPAELVATKLRALYKRRMGRDLFDLWLALTHIGRDPGDILACLDPYRLAGYTTATAVVNLLGTLMIVPSGRTLPTWLARTRASTSTSLRRW